MFNISSHKVHATKIKKECNVNVSTRTIRRHLAKIGMRYQKIPRKILLTKAHKERRVEFVKNWIRTNHDWSRTIFSDQKRFRLDGPDNWMTYASRNVSYERQRGYVKEVV